VGRWIVDDQGRVVTFQAFAQGALTAFNRRTLGAIRAFDRRRLLFYEPALQFAVGFTDLPAVSSSAARLRPVGPAGPCVRLRVRPHSRRRPG
jgi:hypothetical protein